MRGRRVGRQAHMTPQDGSMEDQITVPFAVQVKSGSLTLSCSAKRMRLATTTLRGWLVGGI